MPYSDLIRQESEYTYSANIQFDTENDRKLLRFIPNNTTTSLLREYFTDITRQRSENHSRILYGSYGTGKSHFLTVLSLILSKSHTDGFAFETFIDRLTRYDAGLSADISTYVQDTNRKPFLVIPIVFDFEDFDRCIYFSLKKKLDSLDINVQFKTFFDQAIQLITQWKNAAESRRRLEEACRSTKIKLETLETQLKKYDKRAEKRFQRLFSEMTYGVPYVYEISNLSEAINQAYLTISADYSGIVFIFDEFGRYLEDNINKIKVKSVQDLAEFCDHGTGNNHVILVSHKEISQYTQRLGKNISTEWKKVEGRYKATPINDKQDQCLSLISSILTKDAALWAGFRGRFRTELDRIYRDAAGFHSSQINGVQEENPYEDGFPLHPISLFALDKLSKKVAQNERTFFTYLASKEENSLYRFLESHELDDFHFVGIDNIFDYFEPNIKSVQSDNSYEWYRNLQHALAKNNTNEYDETPETRILKVIAAIGIINDSSALVADKRTILSVIDLPEGELENALMGLCDRKIIKYSGAYNRYDFFEASIFDVEELIIEGTRQVQEKAVLDTLNEVFANFVLYPNQYNREYKINRVFLPIFTTLNELTYRSLASRFSDYYDGVLAILISGTRSYIENILFYRVNAVDDFKDSRIRILHSKIDAHDYNTVIKSQVLDEAAIDLDTINESSSNVLRCYKYYREKLSLRSESELKKLFNCLFDGNRKVIVLITLRHDDVNEQTIFDTINRAGIRLSTADIIKNNLFKSILDKCRPNTNDRERAIKSYEKNWEQTFCADEEVSDLWDKERIFGNVKHNNLEFLLYCVACIKWGENSDLFSKLEDVFDRETAQMGLLELLDLVKEIKEYAEIFKKYVLDLEKTLDDEQESFYFKYDDRVHGLLLILQKFGVQMFYPYVIMRLRQVNQNEWVFS